MCGICGVVGETHGEVASSRTRQMLAAMVHRGPDDEGLLTQPGAALGMRRLSIIDLAGGNQPVYNEDGSVGVVFNGEIYNFLRLKESLESRGHRFRTRSDTEVIVHAYEEWGRECLKHFRGMFAFALWDGRARSAGGQATVLLARDRLGIKPLYYALSGGALLFASEVRSLLASGAVARRLARESVEAFLLFGSVIEPMTLIEGVFSLPPGHSLLVSCDDARSARPVSYWDLAEAVRSLSMQTLPTSVPEAAQAVRPLLEEAVRSHLIADVPLGLFLSSGLDSTALAALASRERGIHTFTIVFPEQEFSEAEIARRTAKQLGAEHRELMVSGEEMLAQLPRAVGALDQPSADGINTFFVSWAARQAGLKVALSGLGGDEVFGGYPTFRTTPRVAAVASVARGIPASLRTTLSDALLAVGRNSGRSARTDALRKFAAVWSRPDSLPHPYFFTRLLFTPQQVEHLLARPAASNASSPWRTSLGRLAAAARDLPGDAAVSSLEMRAYMANMLLRDTDSMSMHHSLEVRVPLLDHPLVEFVTALPDRARRGPGLAKALLAESLGKLLPREVVEQPKRTFTFPWQRWLRGPLGLRVAMRLSGIAPSLADVLVADSVQSVWRGFLMGRTGWARPWSLFVLNEWVRCHVDCQEMPQEQESAVAAPAVLA